jgi:phospholipid/cholesterol/gamma-HCH transport system substrate-binding protein
MDPRVNYTLVGLFIIVLGSAVIAITLWLSIGTSHKSYRTYVAYMSESVSGLNLKAAVKYRGVEVGQVSEIALDRDNPERVRLLLDIEEGTPIKEDTVAVLSTQGITGLAFVDLTGGSRDSPLLEARPGEPYPEIPTGPSLLLRLDSAVSTMLSELSAAAQSLNEVAERINILLNDHNQQAIAGTLENVEQLTGTFAARVDALGESLSHMVTISDNTARVSDELPTLIDRISRSVAAMGKTVSTINQTAQGVDRLVSRVQEDLAQFSRDSLAQVGPLLREMWQLSETLGRMSRELERNPNMLLFGRPALRTGPGE